MIVKVNWDTDGQRIKGLPTIVTVPDDIEVDDVSDWLSDEYGWCVNGWSEESDPSDWRNDPDRPTVY